MTFSSIGDENVTLFNTVQKSLKIQIIHHVIWHKSQLQAILRNGCHTDINKSHHMEHIPTFFRPGY